MNYKTYLNLDSDLKELLDLTFYIKSQLRGKDLLFLSADNRYVRVDASLENYLCIVISLIYIDKDNIFSSHNINIDDVLENLMEIENEVPLESKMIDSIDFDSNMITKEIIDSEKLSFLILRINSKSTYKDFINRFFSGIDVKFFISNEKNIEIEETISSILNVDAEEVEEEEEESSNFLSNLFGGGVKVIGGYEEKSFLEKNGTNLTNEEYIYNPAVGREDLLKKIAIALTTPTLSVLLVGEAGVGKTALARGLAMKIQAGEFLEGMEVIEIDASNFISGKGIVGAFEESMEKLINELEDKNVILLIDEIHQIYNVGSSSINIMNMLKKPIAKGNLRLIGATTKGEYDETLKYDKAFMDRFEVFQVNELEESNIKKIVSDRILYLEDLYKIKLPFLYEEREKFIDYLILTTSKNNRKLNQISHNPRLIIQLLDTIFASAKINRHENVQKDDITYSIINNSKLSSFYKMPLFDTPKETSKILNFTSYRKK